MEKYAYNDSLEKLKEDVNRESKKVYEELFDGMHEELMNKMTDACINANISPHDRTLHTKLYNILAPICLVEFDDLIADKMDKYGWHYTDYAEEYVKEIETASAELLNNFIISYIDTLD